MVEGKTDSAESQSLKEGATQGVSGGDVLAGADSMKALKAMTTSGDTGLKDMNINFGDQQDSAPRAADGKQVPDPEFPYCDRHKGGQDRSKATVTETEKPTTDDKGNTTYSRKVDMNDGYVFDTKIDEKVTCNKDGEVVEHKMKFNEKQDIKFGDNINLHGVANAKGVTEMTITKDSDGGYTVKVSPGQGSLIGGAASKWDTLKISKDGDIMPIPRQD